MTCLMKDFIFWVRLSTMEASGSHGANASNRGSWDPRSRPKDACSTLTLVASAPLVESKQTLRVGMQFIVHIVRVR